MKTKQERLLEMASGRVVFNVENKHGNELLLKTMFLNKTLTMFNYLGLPESIPQKELELLIQVRGYAFITEYKGELVVLGGEFYGEKTDVYGNQLEINCYLPDEKKYKVFNVSDGVLVYNDYLKQGLDYIFNKFSKLINESELTLVTANKWKRVPKLFIANDDSTADSIKNYLERMESGESDFIVSNLLYDSIKVESDSQNSNTLHELIEYDNYLKSMLYEEIGISTNDNMKKERLITDEVKNNLNVVYPLVDNMLDCRKLFLEELNKKYGVKVEVMFSSSWVKPDEEKEEPKEKETPEQEESEDLEEDGNLQNNPN